MQPLVSCGAHLYHVVERGETLYSISWMYGYDYQEVAQWNRSKPPYVIKEGQRLRVAPDGLAPDKNGTEADNRDRVHELETTTTDRMKVVPEVAKSKSEPTVQAAKRMEPLGALSKREGIREKDIPGVLGHDVQWQWPANGGRVVNGFDEQDPGRRGLDIEGNSGQPVFAASRGKVVYSGVGLPRYGKLIIVKHSDTYLSAYAHNKALHVQEGDVVNQGQHIADMGSSGASSTKLHFEIRRNGKAVDPLRLLPKTRH